MYAELYSMTFHHCQVHRASDARGERSVELTGTDVQLTRAQIMIMEAIQDQGGDKRKHGVVEQFPSPILQQQQQQQHRSQTLGNMFGSGEGSDQAAAQQAAAAAQAAAAQAQAAAAAAVAGGQWGMGMPPPYPQRMHPGHHNPHHFHRQMVPFQQAGGGFPSPGGPHGGAGMGRSPTVAKLLIEDKRAGCIIGKAAAGLAELRETTGAHFELARHPLLVGQRLLAIHPPYAAQERCIMLVCEKLGASVASQHAAAAVAAAVAPGGETSLDVAAAAADTGSSPATDSPAATAADPPGEAAAAAPAPSVPEVTTPATPADAEAAAATQSITVRMILPVNMIGRVVEKGGSGLKALREQGLYVNLPREDDPKPGERLLTLRGPPLNVGMGICSVLVRMV